MNRADCDAGELAHPEYPPKCVPWHGVYIRIQQQGLAHLDQGHLQREGGGQPDPPPAQLLSE